MADSPLTPPASPSGKIVALGVHPLSPGIDVEGYYAEINATYYRAHDLKPSQWQGRHIDRLYLRGTVDEFEFGSTLRNLVPITQEHLTPRTNATRSAGYDFTFHAMKSASVMAFVADDQRIVNAFIKARNLTLKMAETLAATRVRRGQGPISNVARRTNNLVIASFMDSPARPVGKSLSDPHLHGHSIVHNATYDEVEGRFKALLGYALNTEVPMLEAVFQTAFAMVTRQLGYHLTWTGREWEITEVPRDTLDLLSKRTAVINESAKDIRSAKERGKVGARTRQPKGDKQAWETLREDWQQQIGAGRCRELAALVAKTKSAPLPSSAIITPDMAVQRAIQHLADKSWSWSRATAVMETIYAGHGFVTRSQAIAAVDGAAQATLKGPDDLWRREPTFDPGQRRDFIAKLFRAARGWVDEKAIDEVFARNPANDQTTFAAIAGQHHPLLATYTTPQVQENAAKCVALAAADHGRSDVLGIPEYRDASLTQEQRRAVKKILGSQDFVTALNIIPGPGKTRLLQEIAKDFAVAHRKVHAVSHDTEAIRFLHDDGFTSARPLAEMLTDTGLKSLAKRDLIIVDGAGGVGGATMLQLLEEAQRAGCRILLVGDMERSSVTWNTDSLRYFVREARIRVASVLHDDPDAPLPTAPGAVEKSLPLALTPSAVAELKTVKDQSVIIAQPEYVHRVDNAAGKIAWLARKGKSFLAIATTQDDADALTGTVRLKRFDAHYKGERRTIPSWTEKTPAAAGEMRPLIEPGNIIELTCDSSLGPAGTRLEVRAKGEKLLLFDSTGKFVGEVPAPPYDSFLIYAKKEFEVAIGDRLRVTRGTIANECMFFENQVLEVTGFAAKGIRCKDGRTLPFDYRHVTYGWVCLPSAIPTEDVDYMVMLPGRERLTEKSVATLATCAAQSRKKIWIFTADGDPFWSVDRQRTIPDVPPAETLLSKSKPRPSPAWHGKIFYQKDQDGAVHELGHGQFVAHLIERGRLAPETLVAYTSNGPWVRAEEDQNLKGVFHPQTSPQPTVPPAQPPAAPLEKKPKQAPVTASVSSAQDAPARKSPSVQEAARENGRDALVVPAPISPPVAASGGSAPAAAVPAWHFETFYLNRSGGYPTSGRHLLDDIDAGKIPPETEVSRYPNSAGKRADQWQEFAPHFKREPIRETPVSTVENVAPTPPTATADPSLPLDATAVVTPATAPGSPAPAPNPHPNSSEAPPPSEPALADATQMPVGATPKTTGKPAGQASPRTDPAPKIAGQIPASSPSAKSTTYTKNKETMIERVKRSIEAGKGDTYEVGEGASPQGPFTLSQLRAQIAGLKIISMTKIRKNGGEPQWAEDHDELKDPLKQARLHPPSPPGAGRPIS